MKSTPVKPTNNTADPDPETLDLSTLRTILAISETGSITAAAERLGLTQPAVSQQVRRLESKLGTALLERVGRGVRLTEAGHALARHGASVSAILTAAAIEVASISGMQQATVRLTAFPSACATIIPTAVAKLRKTHPGIRLTLSEEEPPQAMQRLQTGTSDLAVTFDYEDGLGLDDEVHRTTSVPLLDDELLLVLPRKSEECRSILPSAELKDLGHFEWIAGCVKCRQQLLVMCEQAGFSPNISFATDDYMAVQALVANQVGIALVAQMTLVNSVHPHVMLQRLNPPAYRSIRAVTNIDLARVPAVQAVIAALQDAAQQLALDESVRVDR